MITKFKIFESINLASNGKPSNLTKELYDLVRTHEFKNWFGDWEKNSSSASKIVDDNGEPLILNHGSRSKFTVFDLNKGGESNSIAGVGFWFSSSKEFGEKFANDIWYGDEKEPVLYHAFLSIKNPKIYIPSEDNESEKSIINRKMRDKEDDIVYMSSKWRTVWKENEAFQLAYSGKINDDNKEYYSNRTEKSGEAIQDGLMAYNLNKELKELNNKYYELHYSDSYQKFKTDIYKIAGQNAKDANIGGLGMALDNSKETVKKYVSSLKGQGYDGIIIKQTSFDKENAGGINDQFIAFDSKQIKLADGSNTTFDKNNSDIRK